MFFLCPGFSPCGPAHPAGRMIAVIVPAPAGFGATLLQLAGSLQGMVQGHVQWGFIP